MLLAFFVLAPWAFFCSLRQLGAWCGLRQTELGLLQPRQQAQKRSYLRIKLNAARGSFDSCFRLQAKGKAWKLRRPLPSAIYMFLCVWRILNAITTSYSHECACVYDAFCILKCAMSARAPKRTWMFWVIRHPRHISIDRDDPWSSRLRIRPFHAFGAAF